MGGLLDRMQANADSFRQSYASANDLLNVAVGEALPWVIGLPVIKSKIPPFAQGALPQGAPVTLDKVERLATQLLAILQASYPPPPESPAQARHTNLIPFNKKE